MQFVPAKPRSAWRALTLFFAVVLTFGVLAPVTASAHGGGWLRVHDTVVFLHHGGYMNKTMGDHGKYGDHGKSRFDHKYVPATVKITLSKASKEKVSVGWYAKSGTAKAWKDFKPAAGRVYFKKWQKVAFVKVLVKDTQRPRFDAKQCVLPKPEPKAQNATNAIKTAPRGHEPGGDHGYSHHKKFGKFFLIKLVKPHGARIADGVGIVKILEKNVKPADNGKPGGQRPPRCAPDVMAPAPVS